MSNNSIIDVKQNTAHLNNIMKNYNDDIMCNFYMPTMRKCNALCQY